MEHKNGFTLIEMAIVLVVIGLIVGSIFVGQSMVRQSQLRGVISEYDTYLKGIKEFQDKYLALPGDMNNATGIWVNAATANGDGSSTIGSSNTTGTPSDTAGTGGTGGIVNPGEWFLAWQHLALAGFVPGNFTGTSTDGVTAVIGTNVPASKLPGAGWTLNYYLNTSGNAGLWSDQYGHLLNFGGYISGNYTKGGIITPAEALGLDQKLDDGMPGTGKIRAWRSGDAGPTLANCTATDISQTAQTYNTAYAGQACSLVFLLGF